MNFDKAIERLQSSKKITITVVGDYCLDKYLYIDKDRDELSIETGLIAFQVTKKEIYAGACGTIAANLCSLGVNVRCMGIVGDDGEGYELLKCLEKIGADISYMIKGYNVCTNTYTKPMRVENGKFKEMSRLDFRNFTSTAQDMEDKIIENLKKAVLISDAIILSDQFYELNFSVITDRVRDFVTQLAIDYPRTIFYADSRGFINKYRNIIVKCNNFEVIKCIMPNYNDVITEDMLLKCGLELFMRNKKTVFITLGVNGSMVFDNKVTSVPAFKVEGTIDICGAGDANNAGIVLGLTLGFDEVEAALIGNIVSSITIEQIGVTGTASIEQVIQRLSIISNI
ncbi:MAG TPA: PfkB family carbohydrate kinase [Clostridiaceae bacterium]